MSGDQSERAKALALAEEHRAKADEEQRAMYRLLSDCYPAPTAERWTTAVKEAIATLAEGHRALTFSADAAPLSPGQRPRTRIVPAEHIALPAEVIVGMQIALHDARMRQHAAEAQTAETRAAAMLFKQSAWEDPR